MKLCSIAVLCTLLLTGCGTIFAPTQSKITMPDGTKMALPKNLSADSFVFKREFTDCLGRTNTISLVATNMRVINDPAVISAKTADTTAVINALAQALQQMLAAGLAAAAK